MASKLPSYTQDNLSLVGKMTSQIAAAAARYGVSAEAIAGALAQEQFDQKNSWMNYGRMVLSAAAAHAFLEAMFIEGMARNPFNPNQGASDNILDLYSADPDAMTPAPLCRRAATKPSWRQPSAHICVRALEIINPA